jgi:hypothetical protein
MTDPQPIDQLRAQDGEVLLMRRTGEMNVKVSVGWMRHDGVLRNWFGSRPPTHFCNLPPYAEQS